MADLFEDVDAIGLEAGSHGNFMLRLANDTWPAGLIADELVRPIAALAPHVHFPGYRPDWLPARCRAPEWAAALASAMQDVGSSPRMSGAAAANCALRGFWHEGSVQHIEHDGARRPLTYRPALPVLEIPSVSVSLPAFATFATSFVGFKVGRNPGHFAKAVRLARTLAKQSPDSLFVIYQDSAWLHFHGTPAALSAALAKLGNVLRKQHAKPS
jgi:hypothetical protein